MTNKDQCREAFEAWFSKYHDEACREWGGIDCTNPKGVAEEAWQAARSAPAAPAKLPEPDAYLYVNGEHHGVSLEWRGDMDLAEGTERHNLFTEPKVHELLAAAPKLPQGDGWLPIESAPKDGSLIVVHGNNFNDSALGQHYCIAAWHSGCWMESSEWSAPSELAYLTHWMPLPPPPKHPLP